MSRRAAQFIQADINRIGGWALKKGLKALIITTPSGVQYTVPLDEDFEIKGAKADKNELPDGFTL